MRIPQYDFKVEDPELEGLLIDIRNVINNGRYNPSIVTAVPSVAGEEGQEVLYYNGDVATRYSYVNSAWRALPLGAEVGWGYIETTTAVSATKAVTFVTEFPQAPLVIVSYIGVKTSGSVPTSPADFTSANTLRIVAAYAPAPTGFTAAIYTGNASAMTAGHYEGFSYYAIPVT